MGRLTKGNQVLRSAQGDDRIGRFGLLLCTLAILNYLHDVTLFSIVELKGDRMFGRSNNSPIAQTSKNRAIALEAEGDRFQLRTDIFAMG
jgi:hypothetical protein